MFYVDRAKCKGCGLCVQACSQQAISLNNGAAFINQELCTGCGSCREVCKNGAIYEVEVVQPAAARTDDNQGKPSARSGPGALRENRKRPALVSAFAALAPLAIEGMLTLAEKWAASGRMQGGGRGRKNRGCRRRRKRMALR